MLDVHSLSGRAAAQCLVVVADMSMSTSKGGPGVAVSVYLHGLTPVCEWGPENRV